MNNFGLAAVGFLECLMIGYFANCQEFRRYLNSVSEIRVGRWWDMMVRYVTPAILVTLLFLTYVQRLMKPYGGYPTWAIKVGGWNLLIALLVGSILLSLSLGQHEREMHE